MNKTIKYNFSKIQLLSHFSFSAVTHMGVRSWKITLLVTEDCRTMDFCDFSIPTNDKNQTYTPLMQCLDPCNSKFSAAAN